MKGLHNYDFKGAVASDIMNILFTNQQRPSHLRFKICKELLAFVPTVIYTKKNFYLLDQINKNIDLLKSAGLIDFWNYKLIDKQKIKEEKTNDLKVINLKDLTAVFIVLISGIAISYIVLIYERITQS